MMLHGKACFHRQHHTYLHLRERYTDNSLKANYPWLGLSGNK